MPDQATLSPLPPSAPVDLMHLVGLWVQARSARRTYSGVVLPRGPSPRSWRLRLALEDGRILPVDPGWDIQPHPKLLLDTRGKIRAIAPSTMKAFGTPIYRYGDLPSFALATRTMLQREHRAKAAPGQAVVAHYLVGGASNTYYDLFAIADAEPMPPLSPARQYAWEAARTCDRCGKRFGSPLKPAPLPEKPRFCPACERLTVEEHWIEQARDAQADCARWARAVFADPRTVLAASHRERFGTDIVHYRVETLGGQVVLDARIHPIADASFTMHPDRRAHYDGSVFAGELLEQIRALCDKDATRLITWHGTDIREITHGLHSLLYPDLLAPAASAESDRLGERYELWHAESPPHRYEEEYWYREPKLPWNFVGSADRLWRAVKHDPAAQVQLLREALRQMASGVPPEPTIRRHGQR